jgi:hypothetical protein
MKPRPVYLAPECELGKMALSYWRKRGGNDPQYMRLTGNGFVAFGWRENLPHHTQQEHFVDADGSKYDAGENSIPIIEIVRSA